MHVDNDQAISLRPEIHELLGLVGLEDHHSELLRIASIAVEARKTAIQELARIDSTIPGLGLHNVDVKAEAGGLGSVLEIKDRPIFRPIQYVFMYLRSESLEWLAREIVSMSCLHVETSLKKCLNINYDKPYSVGILLDQRGSQSLDQDLINALSSLNRQVYNKAKHTIENIEIDSHMFSIADSFAVYLTCRVIGSRLLKDSDITTQQGDSVF